MEMTVNEIREAIEREKINAISLDTSVFVNNGLRFAAGPLKHLSQFREGPVRLLVSEIVRLELRSQLTEKASEARGMFDKAIRKLRQSAWQLSEHAVSELMSDAFHDTSVEAVVEGVLDSYLESTGALLVRSNKAEIDEIVDRYFDGKPPFSTPKKKDEFPDAIALSSLQKWATENDTTVLIVTTDSDWLSYCVESHNLVAIGDLPTALGCFQDRMATHRSFEFVERFERGHFREIVEQIVSSVRNEQGNAEFTIEPDSQFYCEEEGAEATFNQVSLFEAVGRADVELVHVLNGEATLHMEFSVSVDVVAHFSFAKWDGIDKEYIPMGSSTVEDTKEISVDVYVTLGGDLPDSPKVIGIEVEPILIHLEYGDLEPDWMNDPNNFE